jgi:hypothetical protein
VRSRTSLSGAGIAGAIIGPLAGVALIIALVVLFLRNKNRKAPVPEPASEPASEPDKAPVSQMQSPSSGHPTQYGQYSGGKESFQTYSTDASRPVSMPPVYGGQSSPATLNELPVTHYGQGSLGPMNELPATRYGQAVPATVNELPGTHYNQGSPEMRSELPATHYGQQPETVDYYPSPNGPPPGSVELPVPTSQYNQASIGPYYPPEVKSPT